jgi:hypothetical protein
VCEATGGGRSNWRTLLKPGVRRSGMRFVFMGTLLISVPRLYVGMQVQTKEMQAGVQEELSSSESW